jgi:proline dehydrogenase
MINELIIKTMPLVPKSIVYIFAKKYIAGPELQDSVNATKHLMTLKGCSTIDVLGEFVTKKDEAVHEKNECSLVLDAIHNNNLTSYLSVKPTSLGMGIDFDFGFANIKELVVKAKSLGIFVRLDMENSPYTTQTLDMYKKFRDDGFDNVGFVIQAYMRRSMDDVSKLLSYKPNVRLCKGIYVEAESIAYKEFEEVRENYRKLLNLMLDNGVYVGIATHDEELIKFGLQEVKRRNLKRDEYEFQMLLGVRENRRNEILQLGHNLRVYVPFGKDWYGYSSRRLKENPQMVGHIIKSILGFNK